MTSSWREFGSSQQQGVEDPLERNKKDEDERKRQQAEQKRRQQQESQKRQQEEAARTRNPLQPIQDALGQDVGKPILQGIDRVFGTNLDEIREQNIQKAGGREGIKKRQEEIQQNVEQEAYKGVNAIGSEAIRAVVKAPVNILEGVLNTGELVKDTLSLSAPSGLTKDPTKNPFDRRYVQAAYDFKIQGAKTPVGKLAEGLLTFGITMRQAAVRLPKGVVGLGTGGKGLKGAVASGIVPGAIADFLLFKPGDGNLSNLVQDLVPEEYRASFMFALANDKEDNPWIARLKTTLEGAGVGAAADSLIFLTVGRNAAQRALKAGKTKDQAIAEGVKAADEAKTQLDKDSVKNTRAEGFRWSETQQLETENLLNKEQGLVDQELQMREAGIAEDDPNLQKVLDDLAEVRLSQAQLDQEIIRGYDPENPNLIPQERSATNQESDINRVVKQQLEVENGPIPAAARTADTPSAFRTNQAAFGGSDHILTDAAYRRLNLTDGVEDFVRQTTRRADLQSLAKGLGRSVDSIVFDAAKIVQEVRDATRLWNEPTDNITDALKQSGAFMEVRGATDGTSGDILTREGVVALKGLITDTSNQIFDLALNADKMLEARIVGGNQFDRMVDRLVTLLGFHKQAAVFHGGGLQAFGLDLMSGINIKGDIDEGTDLTLKQVKDWAAKVKELKRIDDPQAQDELNKLVRAMALAGGNPAKAVNFTYIAAKLGADELMNYMYNSILSGPITHLRNLMGNSYALLERPTSIMFRGVITNDETLRRSAMAGYHAITTSINEAWKVGWTSMKTGDSVNLNSKFVIEDAQALAGIERLKMAAQPGTAEERAAGCIEALYRFTHNPIISLPNRMLTGADDFFKTLNARQHIQTTAMYKAMSEAKSDNDVEGIFQSYMKEFSKKIDPTTGRILDPNLLDYAERATFQNDPGGLTNSVANAINSIPFGAGRLFVPFIRTPANILAYTGQHTPGLARYLGQYKEALRSGDELLIAELKGREAIGTMTVGLVGMTALTGNITGNGPVDQRERDIWLRAGNRPMSIRVGDEWISYQALEPLSTIMATVADIAMLANMGAADAAERLAGQVGFALAAAITEKSYLAGLAGLSDLLDPNNMTADGVTKGILNTANNFIPYAGARRMLANALDPYMKEVDNELQRVLNVALPGYKLLGPTKIDFLTGEEVSSSAGGLYNAISPIRISPVGQDPVKDMLVDINFELKDVIKTGPSGVELTAEQRQTLSKEMYDSGVRQRLESLMNQDWFKESVADWKGRGLSFSTESNRPRHYQAVQRLITSAKETSFRKMQRADPNFADMVRKEQKQKVQFRRGVYDDVNSLTNFAK